jgi:hypothetical protein
MRLTGYAATLVCALACTERPGKDGTTDTGSGTADCGMSTIRTHPAPLPLLMEFLERDARGEFVKHSDWFSSAVTCPDHEAGADVASEASGYQTRVLREAADTVQLEVVWSRLGYVSAAGMEEALGAEFDTLTAVRTPHGWRIASPALRPHVPPLVPKAQPQASGSRPDV